MLLGGVQHHPRFVDPAVRRSCTDTGLDLVELRTPVEVRETGSMTAAAFRPRALLLATAPAAGRTAPEGPASLRDFADEPWILPPEQSSDGRAVRLARRRLDVEARVDHVVTGTASTLSLVAAGLGVAPVAASRRSRTRCSRCAGGDRPRCPSPTGWSGPWCWRTAGSPRRSRGCARSSTPSGPR
ncbi:LysR substrate-binding domain-containing protein [Geodermatophilus sp. SYSU D00779]